MLRLYFRSFSWTCPLFALFFLGTLEGTPFELHEHKCLARYFKAYEEDVSIEEMIDFLTAIKLELLGKKVAVPTLRELFEWVCELVQYTDSAFPESEARKIMDLLEERDSAMHMQKGCFYQIKNKKNEFSEEKKTEISGKIAFGLCKMLAGALCIIIPHPAALTLGGVLLAGGLQDITEDMVKKDEEDRMREEMLKPRAPRTHIP